MADRIPQFENTEPVLQTQTVNSKAAGFEAYAQAFGQVANQAEDNLAKMETDASKTQYMHSVASIEQVKNDSQIKMLQDPNHAEAAAKSMKETTDEIVKNTSVNKDDRRNLDYYAQTSANNVAFKAAETNVRQTQLMGAYTHYANWPTELKAYQEAIIADPTGKTAENLQKGMVSSLRGLVMTGALTPAQAGSSISAMSAVADVAADHIAVYGNQHATAQDYHTVTSSPLNQGTSNVGTPVDGHTQWMTDFYNNDRSFQGVLADISNRMLPNPMAFDNLQPAQRQRAIQAIQGVQVAEGYINSGQPFPVIQKTYDALAQKDQVLSYRDEATKHALGNYISGLKGGNYLQVIGQTPGGGEIMQNFVNRNAAIAGSSMTDDQKSQMFLENKNNMVTQAASYGAATHMPSQYVQPVPPQDVSLLQNGFKSGQSPEQVLQVVGQYNKNNVAYIANVLPKANQRMAVAAVAYAPTTIAPQDKLDFIAANQDGRQFNDLILPEKVSAGIKSRVINNLKDQINLVGQQYNPENAQTLQNAMIGNTINYAKFLAQKNNDFAMNSWGSNWKDYVDKASRIYTTSFEKMSGSNYVVNPNQLPTPLTKAQLDVLATYATHEGEQYLKNGRKDFEFNSALGRNPLKMVFSPTNEVLAVDGNGKTYFSVPFTTSLISHAQKVVKDLQEQQMKEQMESIQNQFMGGIKRSKP